MTPRQADTLRAVRGMLDHLEGIVRALEAEVAPELSPGHRLEPEWTEGEPVPRVKWVAGGIRPSVPDSIPPMCPEAFDGRCCLKRSGHDGDHYHRGRHGDPPAVWWVNEQDKETDHG